MRDSISTDEVAGMVLGPFNPRIAPSWECHLGTLDGIPDGCPAVGSSGAPAPCSCLGREWHASARLLAPAQPRPHLLPDLRPPRDATD